MDIGGHQLCLLEPLCVCVYFSHMVIFPSRLFCPLSVLFVVSDRKPNPNWLYPHKEFVGSCKRKVQMKVCFRC